MTQQRLFGDADRPEYPAPGGQSYSHKTVYLGVVVWQWRRWCDARMWSG